jgi:hypothetical protein
MPYEFCSDPFAGLATSALVTVKAITGRKPRDDLARSVVDFGALRIVGIRPKMRLEGAVRNVVDLD